MADLIFEDPRLVSIYDNFDGTRVDLEHYLALALELKAKSVLDVGSGTGCFACMLANQGFEVVGVEPAKASLEFAQTKPLAQKVRWILGDATTLPAMKVDFVVMTGNVAQVFATDAAWNDTLSGLRKVLNPNGHLVFEVRDPSKKAWMEWTKEKTYKKISIPNVGQVEVWCEVTGVSQQLVSFRWTYVFESDGAVISSDSTLRFREKEEIVSSLHEAGFSVKEIRDAPDRPGKEFVFIAQLRYAE